MTGQDRQGRVDPRREEIGRRLKAYRLGSGLTAEDVADRLDISRSALYRMEAGDIVKIETLDRLAEVLDTSVASLLDVGVEYYAKAAAYFERMRQLEAEAVEVIANFAPMSYLLTGESYSRYLRHMLIESLPGDVGATPAAIAEIDTVLAILRERKIGARQRIVSLISVPEIEHFLQLGLIGRFGLPEAEWARRREAARDEIENIARVLDAPPPGIELGLVEDAMPNITFELFRLPDRTVLALSPFRLGEQPNIRYGVASVTAAEEPVALYGRLAEELRRRALKGPAAAARLRDIIARTAGRALTEGESRLTRERVQPKKTGRKSYRPEVNSP